MAPVSTSRARRAAQAVLHRVQKRIGAEVADSELDVDAWVIAPHPDDEVLGCGGTIACKVAQGARVRVCFLTDGSSSHQRWIPKVELRALREGEALSACERLGVSRDDVVFLGFEDGSLAQHVDDAAAALRRLFKEWPGVEVYAPHHREQPEDHRAACWVARTAMQGLRFPSVYLEYPVWCWNEWPWVELSGASGLRKAARAGAGFHRSLRLMNECRWQVPLDDLRGQKWHALEAHASQMRGLAEVEDSPTLVGFAGGEFLARFFSSHEFFARYESPPPIPRWPSDQKRP